MGSFKVRRAGESPMKNFNTANLAEILVFIVLKCFDLLRLQEVVFKCLNNHRLLLITKNKVFFFFLGASIHCM